MHSLRSLFVAAGALALGATMSLAACSSSSSDASTPAGSAGSSDTGGAGGTSAGGSGGAQTLYDKYGGAPTVKKVVDDAVAGLLGDTTEAPFFSVVGTSGHDTEDHLKSCLRLQFTAVLGGPATYPGNGDDGTACRDMKTAHADLDIPADVFDKFIMDLGGVLTTDGVSMDDVTALAGELEGLKPDIVTATDGAGGTGGSGGAGDSGAGGSLARSRWKQPRVLSHESLGGRSNERCSASR